MYLAQHPELRACFTRRGNLVGGLYSLHVEMSYGNCLAVSVQVAIESAR